MFMDIELNIANISSSQLIYEFTNPYQNASKLF